MPEVSAKQPAADAAALAANGTEANGTGANGTGVYGTGVYGTGAQGNRPFIIPIFTPHAGCPHRCVFCNQVAISGMREGALSPDDIHARIRKFLEYKGPRRGRVQVAFYGGNFLGLEHDTIHSFLEAVALHIEAGRVDGIRFSTRPDTIDQSTLALIKGFPVHTIELGAQSMDDHVLLVSDRGHTAADTERAVAFLKTAGYEVGLQLMVGLPGEDEDRAFRSAYRAASLEPDCVRLYPTLVMKHSRLARMYLAGRYQPLSLRACVERVKRIYLIFRERGADVIRMGLQASYDAGRRAPHMSGLLEGPYHPAFGHLVHAKIFLDKAASVLKSIRPKGQVTIRVHPRSVSRMRGLKNGNMRILKTQFGLTSIDIREDEKLAEDELRMQP